MILLDSKDLKTSSNISLNISQDKNKKTTLSFSELLNGVSNTDAKEQKNSKLIQNGALVLNLEKKDDKKSTPILGKKSQKEDFSSLLKNPHNEDKKILPAKVLKKDAPVLQNFEINPKITDQITSKEFKTLIIDAKRYLKDQILQTDGYKKAQIKDLPKTLKALVEIAKKFDIDITKISLEDVKNTSKIKTDLKHEVRPELKDVKQEIKTDLKHDTKSELKDVKQEIKTDLKHEAKPELKDVKQEIKYTPLFKAQASQNITTTEQTLKAREFKIAEIAQPKTAKQRADETLKLLLRGEKAQKVDTSGINMTSDFSVATAKVIAPSVTTQDHRTLESLIRSESNEQSVYKQENNINLPKNESLEVKINEAKQLTKYLSQDVKMAIDNYKSPFTRVKVQLNPQRLGEIDLTVVQRGKNLHVNISSNNTAINALAMNANDLKIQLNNNGIQNASLSFNSGSSDGSQTNQQQNQRQNQQASQEYNYFDNEEQNEEILNSLEIVVPNYA